MNIMKKISLILFLFSCTYLMYGATSNGTITEGWLTVEDFEGYTVGALLSVSKSDISAEVKAHPSSTQAAYLSGSNNNHYFTVDVTLPQGKNLSDLTSLSLDLYIESASYKNLEIWINGTKVHSVSNLINGTNSNLGAKEFAFSSFNQTGASTVIQNAGNTFSIGIGANRMNGSTFYVDNVKLYGESLKDEVEPEVLYTATLNPGSGTCLLDKVTETGEGVGVELPQALPSVACVAEGFTFAGWAQNLVTETETPPTLIPVGHWGVSENTTLYAVYTDGTVFNSTPECTADNGSENGTIVNGWLMVEDFEGYDADASLLVDNAEVSALVKSLALSKAAYLSGVNNNHYLIINATLPSGKVLSNFKSLSVDLYIESASYKNFDIWINGTKVHSVGNLINGTNSNLGTKEFVFSSFNQSGASSVIENATNIVSIGLGVSRMSGTTFYVDNVKLQENISTSIETEKAYGFSYFNNIIEGDNAFDELAIYDLRGQLISLDKNITSKDITNVPKGAYLVKATSSGYLITKKIIKE